MKILITLLLTLFISGQAYAESSEEVMTKGKIISIDSTNSTVSHKYVVIYKKQLYHCEVDKREVICYSPKDKDVRQYNN